MWPYEYGPRRQNNRRTNGVTEPSSYSTVNMVFYLIYSMSKWIITYFELLPNIGILPIAALVLGR
ncbi:hypothetical protein Goklo_005819 [Gossypium klotzschianum]|uniref:Uncharacterized protein n=2 Tax=Gossypium klotzschianum TaxID=34286 RepID=A0A7J8VFF2_9ROSI|nr:hypothetical protein [Gossypium klotzschianum]